MAGCAAAKFKQPTWRAASTSAARARVRGSGTKPAASRPRIDLIEALSICEEKARATDPVEAETRGVAVPIGIEVHADSQERLPISHNLATLLGKLATTRSIRRMRMFKR